MKILKKIDSAESAQNDADDDQYTVDTHTASSSKAPLSPTGLPKHNWLTTGNSLDPHDLRDVRMT